ncbi:hypothetical protein [Protofrankia symbiont of Coriaria ruscifolia]|uniref:hypothetical protein n=1 Tax=Protofrankia symbiont of Coriaria ruscifolia TaxID=1306542 RepID=UPI0010412F45|nr:hypothetical protein [Protofrankia symbiont of Coriaria ruscifolia]
MLFTDKLNGIAADITPAAAAPAEQTAAATDVPRLRAAVPAFEQRGISPVTQRCAHRLPAQLRPCRMPEVALGL